MLETEKNFNLKAVSDLDWLNANLVWNLLNSENVKLCKLRNYLPDAGSMPSNNEKLLCTLPSGLRSRLTFTFWWHVFHCSIQVFWNEIDVTKPLTFFQFFLLFLNYYEAMPNCLKGCYYGWRTFQPRRTFQPQNFQPQTFQPRIFQPWTLQPWIFQSQILNWKVQGWEVWVWKVHGWKVWGWEVQGWKVNGWKVRGWNICGWSLGLKCPSTY